MSEALFSSAVLGMEAAAGYRLRYLEVFNWGTFDGHVWRLTPDAQTALLTGDIGSGKSTLVDALTTLLMPSHRIAYNKAAGAEAKERSLRSYVEGHYKSERAEDSGRSRAIGLRTPGRTYSVLLGVFGNEGYDETVTLAQVFQQREAAGQPDRFFVTAKSALSIASDFAGFGTKLLDLRKRLRAGGAEIFDTFPKYGTSLRRLLGIRSEQALELFHQTVSMKSVGNLNDFVRDHMLEPSDATAKVKDVIGHFDDLTRAHDAVKRAREQLETLAPVVAMAEKYDTALHQRDAAEQQRAAVRPFIAEMRSQLLTTDIAHLRADGERLRVEFDAIREQQRHLADEREALVIERAQAGGDRIGDLERMARDAHEEATTRRRARTQFDAAVADAGLAAVESAAEFAVLTARVAEQRPALTERKRDLDTEFAEAIGSEKELQTRRDQLEAELTSLEQRTSNLPGEYIDIREQLCRDLAVSADEIPYAGELLDVHEDHTEWRGVAERVLRSFALTLLVTQPHYEAVTDWVNGRRLTALGRGNRQVGMRLTYERVPERQIRLQPEPHAGLVLADCLQVKPGPFERYLAIELTKRADHRCAADLAEFRRERRAVTREGQVRSGERHDKDDRFRVDDPRRWVFGWDNEHKIAVLRAEVTEVERDQAVAVAEAARISDEREAIQSRLYALIRLEGYRGWDDLDFAEAEARAAAHEAERERLQAGSSRLAEITQALDHNAEQTRLGEQRAETITGQRATTTHAIEQAQRTQRRDDELIAAMTADDLARARASYDALRNRLGTEVPTAAEECTRVESALTDALHQRTERLNRELGGYSHNLTQAMGEVLRRWPELRADMDAHVEARADFLAFRERVVTDDLPRFEDEFERQLHQNAIQELAAFNNWLNRQAAAIDERVELINEALGTVPYNPGRYIRLEKQPTPNQEVSQFRAELRNLTNDALVVGGDQYSEERFLDVKRILERFRGREGYADSDKKWLKLVTDVRTWFVFSASERDQETDEEWEHYSDSDGKSGGQKEKLAYTILAASLAYQFGLEWGATKSKDFRFAVIDEAFGRGSDVSTRYALELFAKLGLQLLIVTPLQKVHVIEPYVQAIGFVDNPSGTSSRLHTMTIEEYRTRRDGQSP